MDIQGPEFRDLIRNTTSRFELWKRILKEAEVEIMVEIGVWKGDFADQILTQCKRIKRYYMIDPWANLPDWNKPFNVSSQVFGAVYDEAMRKTEFAAPKRIILRGRTKEVISNIPDNSIDFAYIDGDHTLRGITIDLIKLFPKIREGGFIGGDDFTNDPWPHAIRYEPTLVCPFSIYYAEAVDMPITVMPYNQFIIHKTAKSSFTFNDITGSYGNLSLIIKPSRFIKSVLKRKVKSILSKTGILSEYQ